MSELLKEARDKFMLAQQNKINSLQKQLDIAMKTLNWYSWNIKGDIGKRADKAIDKIIGFDSEKELEKLKEELSGDDETFDRFYEKSGN